MARPRNRGFTRSARRQLTWVGPAEQAYVTVTNGSKVIIASFDAATNGLPKPTVVRTRGEVSVVPTTFAADLDIIGAYGLAIVSDRAFAAGAASIPGPFTDAGWDGWFVWRSFSQHVEFIDGTGFLITRMAHEVDSKAMRKITDDETLVLMAESQAGAFKISMPLRFLFKLS